MKKHNGVDVYGLDGSLIGRVDEPHDAEDCEAACEDAVHKVLGHETAYEAPDVREARRGASAGWSRAYAAGYDDIDWASKN